MTMPRAIFCLVVLAALAVWATGAPEPAAPPKSTDALEGEQVLELERAQRAELRAFYTAPPAIPHDPTLLSTNDCLTCHGEVRELSERTSPKTPHPHLTNCTQCHVSSYPAFGEKAAPVKSTWQGLEQPYGGAQARPVAPPVIPHRIFLRENCTACHSPSSPYESLRSPHPERSRCLQCHVPDGEVEFQLTGRPTGASAMGSHPEE